MSERKKRILLWIVGVAFIWFLVTPQRFSSIGYSVIRESDIPESILAFADINHGIKDTESFSKWNSFHKNQKRSIEICQIYNNSLKDVSLHPREDMVFKSFLEVIPGGRWTPANCTPKIKVLIIVPYREREEQLKSFLKIMHIFLQKQNLEYTIVVSEQSNRSQFNRAKLFNIGYLEAKSLYQDIPCVIFHDVDLIPLDYRNIYGCSVEGPRHLSANLQQFRYLLPYENLFGGVIAIPSRLFESVDGFSNEYFGWGGEDDDFRQNRIKDYEIVRFEPSIARYTMLPHKKAIPNPKRFNLLRSFQNHFDLTNDSHPRIRSSSKPNLGSMFDGLSTTQYKLISNEKRKLLTHILSDF